MSIIHGLEIEKFFINRCIELAEKSLKEGDLPFGAVIVKDSRIVAEGKNTGLKDITGHAEINAIKKALRINPTIDLSKCTLYSNFEPCAMCSFVIRDVGVGRVVFSVESPHLGGYSKWKILLDKTISPLFLSSGKHKPPAILKGILKEKAKEIFDNLKWKMHLKEKKKL